MLTVRTSSHSRAKLPDSCMLRTRWRSLASTSSGVAPEMPKCLKPRVGADAGCRSAEAARIIDEHGYIAHVVDRRKEAAAKRRQPGKKARRWIVEVCHSWFNRFRKPLVRYEELECSFVALDHLAAATIAFRKVPLKVNIIYG